VIIAAESAAEYPFKLSEQRTLAQNVNYLTHMDHCINLGQMRLDHDPECMTPDERRKFEELKTELRRAVNMVERTSGYRHPSHQVATEGQDGQNVLWQ
jgi:hypothetical protein